MCTVERFLSEQLVLRVNREDSWKNHSGFLIPSHKTQELSPCYSHPRHLLHLIILLCHYFLLH